MKGKCIIVSAPSGAGKTTIVRNLIKLGLGLEFSISATSRSQRPNEVDEKDYYFLSELEFRNRIKNDEFLEWEEVYPGQFYGTLKSEINRIWENNHTVIFDVDVVGGLNLKTYFKQNALALFIMPPSIQELKNRLRERDTESIEKIEMRVNKAEIELKRANEFDRIIVNDNLAQALWDSEYLVSRFLKFNNPSS